MSGLKIKDIGEIGPEFIVFGGPYSNLQATQGLLAHARAKGLGPDQLICTGDAVAYAGDPAATIETLDGQCHWIAGNCEKQLVAGADDCGCGFDEGSNCDLWSAQWYALARAELGPRHLDIMAACPDILVFQSAGARAAVIHGGVDDIARYIWPSDPTHVFQQEIDRLEQLTGPLDLVLAGHCGLVFERMIGTVQWINAGVIGMPPHDGRPQTRFIHVKIGHHIVCRLDYDHATAAQTAREKSYPRAYSTALESGIWPSEDILPEMLRR